MRKRSVQSNTWKAIRNIGLVYLISASIQNTLQGQNDTVLHYQQQTSSIDSSIYNSLQHIHIDCNDSSTIQWLDEQKDFFEQNHKHITQGLKNKYFLHISNLLYKHTGNQQTYKKNIGKILRIQSKYLPSFLTIGSDMINADLENFSAKDKKNFVVNLIKKHDDKLLTYWLQNISTKNSESILSTIKDCKQFTTTAVQKKQIYPIRFLDSQYASEQITIGFYTRNISEKPVTKESPFVHIHQETENSIAYSDFSGATIGGELCAYTQGLLLDRQDTLGKEKNNAFVHISPELSNKDFCTHTRFLLEKILPQNKKNITIVMTAFGAYGKHTTNNTQEIILSNKNSKFGIQKGSEKMIKNLVDVSPWMKSYKAIKKGFRITTESGQKLNIICGLLPVDKNFSENFITQDPNDIPGNGIKQVLSSIDKTVNPDIFLAFGQFDNPDAGLITPINSKNGNKQLYIIEGTNQYYDVKNSYINNPDNVKTSHKGANIKLFNLLQKANGAKTLSIK